MTRLFGTDGIRGRAGQDLTPELAADVAAALATACRTGILGENARPRVVVGRDTRPSGPALENAVVDGLTRAGADAVRAGIVPTPAVAYLTSSLPAAAGVVVSASHNPPEDNGLKFFGPGGWKLTVDAEQTIEQLVGRGHTRPSAGAVDTVDGAALYVASTASVLSSTAHTAPHSTSRRPAFGDWGRRSRRSTHPPMVPASTRAAERCTPRSSPPSPRRRGRSA
jgi:phosphoglucosamine mutase